MSGRTDGGAGGAAGFEGIWRVPDAQVSSGRMPGYVAAVRIGGQSAVHAGGTMSVGAGSPPMAGDTLFRVAMDQRDLAPGPSLPPMSPDEFVARVAGLPLAFQPGEGWLYHTGIDLLGVLLARATGKPLSDLVAERVTGPLGMTCTGFWTPHADRLATAYRPGPDGLTETDGARTSPPAFEALGSGLVSSAPDLLRFFCALADGGAPVLTADSVALMTTDALTAAQRDQALPIVGSGASWGLGTGVDTEAARPWMAPGRWGWTGGSGTTAYADPVRGTVSVLLTQRQMTGPQDGFDGFWTAVARAAGKA
jgi:CubicO group peptidase (beta-lactamase class C family)